MEEPLTIRIRAAIAAYLTKTSGTAVPASRVKPSRLAPLASAAFVADGRAAALLPLLNAGLERCVLDSVPLLSRIETQNGWLLFELSDAWWERLCTLAKALPDRDDGSYLQNRMRTLSRHGDAPCPADARVRCAVWQTYLAHDAGRFPPETERAVLTMTHHLTGMPRVRLEHACGGAALAICRLKGDTPCS